MRRKREIQEPGQSLGLGGLDFLTFDSVVSASRAHAPVHWALTPGQHPDEAGGGMGPGHARPPARRSGLAHPWAAPVEAEACSG